MCTASMAWPGWMIKDANLPGRPVCKVLFAATLSRDMFGILRKKGCVPHSGATPIFAPSPDTGPVTAFHGMHGQRKVGAIRGINN